MAMELLFDFDKLGDKSEKATKTTIATLKKNGIIINDVDSTSAKRSSGITYKELGLTATDSQRVVLMIKKTGDIFKVKVNGKELPIKNQDDPKKALEEIAKKLDNGRLAFQKKLAKAKVKLPPKMKSTVGGKEKLLAEKEKSLDEAIAEAKKELEKLRD
ncbi:defense against restriction DarA-related protein [Spirabiliibacterium falconis]|uniref:defense against restriction DarA-related protein n=1 Tax=Spirabiliibacterium falconis TaxID=572023 RepID=UPI001AACDC09|nr:hypothetical protein [Spirabiliibacterium falconis]MBE2895264.1 hypothetical protein [Spirabiliibacterium falconis]